MIDVNAIFFRAANEVVSKEERRYYLNGVYVQPHPDKGVLLTATDGHRLVCIHDQTGKCTKAAIIRVAARAISGVKLQKNQPDAPRLTVDKDGIVTCGSYRSVSSAVIDGTYPDYPRVLTPLVHGAVKKSYAPAAFKPEYLAGFAKVAAILGDPGAAMQLVIFAECDPALFLFANAPEAFGVLMPMRHAMQPALPAFMRPIVEPCMPKLEEQSAATRKPAKRKAA